MLRLKFQLIFIYILFVSEIAYSQVNSNEKPR